MKGIRCAGTLWRSNDRFDGYAAKVHDRFEICVWQFGERWQCKVFITYAGGSDGGKAAVGVPISPTRKQAMERGVRWVRRYIHRGPQSVEKILHYCYTHWKSIYRTRLDVLEQLFFAIGNRYSWLDGALIRYDQGPAPKLDKQSVRLDKEQRAILKNLKLGFRDWSAKKQRVGRSLVRTLKADFLKSNREERRFRAPLPDDGARRAFIPVDKKFSLICSVPDDVLPDWLALAFEAAITLRDRSLINADTGDADQQKRQRRNRVIGAQIVKDLKRRFLLLPKTP